jgi:hypothetical protein
MKKWSMLQDTLKLLKGNNFIFTKEYNHSQMSQKSCRTNIKITNFVAYVYMEIPKHPFLYWFFFSKKEEEVILEVFNFP